MITVTYVTTNPCRLVTYFTTGLGYIHTAGMVYLGGLYYSEIATKGQFVDLCPDVTLKG